MYGRLMTTETCTARKRTPTATGDLEVRCALAPDHVEQGDEQHEAWVGVFPVRWRDGQQPN